MRPKPAGSMKIRVEAIAHYLERASAGIIARKKEQIGGFGPLLARECQCVGEKTPTRRDAPSAYPHRFGPSFVLSLSPIFSSAQPKPSRAFECYVMLPCNRFARQSPLLRRKDFP